ncbi:MAG: hypothetical protein ABIY37_12560 [Devosia sp.]
MEFDHHRARAGRAWRKYRARSEAVNPVTAARLHKAWSDAIDDALKTAEAISRERPGDLGDLLIQCEAIWWWAREDDNVLDGSSRTWLGRFRRSLRGLAMQE